MLSIILIASVLVAVTVAVHVAGIAVLLKALKELHPILPTRFWPITRLLVAVIWLLMLFHLAEISIWGWFYLWWGCLPDAEAAVYFSGVTYTSIGYGDLDEGDRNQLRGLVQLDHPWSKIILVNPLSPSNGFEM